MVALLRDMEFFLFWIMPGSLHDQLSYDYGGRVQLMQGFISSDRIIGRVKGMHGNDGYYAVN